MDNPKSFLSLEDEIDLRRSIRKIYATEGMDGVLMAMGEIAQSLSIFGDMLQELGEDAKKRNDGNKGENI